MFKNLSKYRHIYCDAPKQEACHVGLRLSTVTGDQQHVKASARYFSVALVGGGGLVYVGRHDRPGQFAPGHTPVLRGHRGAVLDFEWSPFDDATLATASDDTKIKIWRVPEEWEPINERGASDRSKEDITQSIGNLDGHDNKVNLLRYHPTASNVLASASYDNTVRLWDVEAARELTKFPLVTSSGNPDLCQDIAWDYKGENYAVSCKDKMVMFLDARTAKITTGVKAHGSARCTKVVYLGSESNKALTTGHSASGNRVVKVWDLRNMDSSLHSEKVDTQSGTLLPLYDIDTDVIYLCGKGDGNVRVCAFNDGKPYFRRLNDGFRSATPLKGGCLVPKRGLDVLKCETARLLKVATDTGKGEPGVQPLSFVVPRKDSRFQADIFPDTASAVPAHTAGKWWGGSRKSPVLESLDPAKKEALVEVSAEVPTEVSTEKVDTEMAQSDEPESVQSLLKRINYLEGKLEEAGISYDRDGKKPQQSTSQTQSAPKSSKSSTRRGSLMGFKRSISRGVS